MEPPFDVLGVEPDADEGAVERAYRRRVKETHPDHGGTVREFQRVRAAYEALKSGHVGRDADPGTPGGAEWTTADETAPDRPADRVEYLNYEVVEDHGWDFDDEAVFEKAAGAGLDPADHGEVEVRSGESLLQAAERHGFAWPFACRGGACANCAVAVRSGDLEMPANHVLPQEMVDRGVRLSCVGTPTPGSTKVVYNVKHRPDLDDLRLPPNRFDLAQHGD